MYQIRSQGYVYNEVEHPAAVFDKESGTLLQIGEKEQMLSYMEWVSERYQKAGYPEMVEALTYIDLPKNQQEIDKVFQITGYIKNLYQREVAPNVH